MQIKFKQRYKCMLLWDTYNILSVKLLNLQAYIFIRVLVVRASARMCERGMWSWFCGFYVYKYLQTHAAMWSLEGLIDWSLLLQLILYGMGIT